ncbi:hypothetical protein HPP92_018783 [Vanilla planifolia]|uniref:BZIP domain-containing protein n=1 Tax=Vanilla planifolia TaxID=51239 RepID=A0A835UIQ8_VANPL|nr:hypothetical protein HPP92_018783 [Vanilla planifolia]
MAWPHFIPSSFPSSASSDHALKPSIYFLNGTADQASKNGFRSAVAEEHPLRNFYAGGGGESVDPAPDGTVERKGSAGDGSGYNEMTLEDYLSKGSGARSEDTKVAAVGLGFGVESVAGDRLGGQREIDLEAAGTQMTGIVERGVALGSGGGRGRGRKRPGLDSADRVALHRQRRMIKNRESAARSRERKQQYTHQLEQTVFKLEEENAFLLKEREKLTKMRFEKIMQAMPIPEKKQKKDLRRSNSFP